MSDGDEVPAAENQRRQSKFAVGDRWWWGRAGSAQLTRLDLSCAKREAIPEIELSGRLVSPAP